MLVICCYITIYLKLQWLKTTINIYYFPVPVGKEFGVTQLGGSVSGDLMRLRRHLVLQSSEGLTEAGGPSLLIWRIHMSDRLVLGVSKML